MSNREDLVRKLTEIQKEFRGFPEEQTLKDAIDTLNQKSDLFGNTVLVTDILRMAKQLGRYCRGRDCDECVFRYLNCPASDWSRDINANLLSEHEGETATLNYDD